MKPPCDCEACTGPTLPICECCQRPVERVRGSIWGHDAICIECFCQWYDPDNASFDHLNARSIGNYVRSKYGLPPLDPSPAPGEPGKG